MIPCLHHGFRQIPRPPCLQPRTEVDEWAIGRRPISQSEAGLSTMRVPFPFNDQSFVWASPDSSLFRLILLLRLCLSSFCWFGGFASLGFPDVVSNISRVVLIDAGVVSRGLVLVSCLITSVRCHFLQGIEIATVADRTLLAVVSTLFPLRIGFLFTVHKFSSPLCLFRPFVFVLSVVDTYPTSSRPRLSVYC